MSQSSREDSKSSGSNTPFTLSSSADDLECDVTGLQHYIALGCLHLNSSFSLNRNQKPHAEWLELIQSDLAEEIKLLISPEVSKLLNAQWIRMFLHQPTSDDNDTHHVVRVYVIPEDWGRRTVDRSSRGLKAALRVVLQQIDTSPQSWSGKRSPEKRTLFDPWATAEPLSLYYLFNTLPSPSPQPERIKSRYSRDAAQDLLDSAACSQWEEFGEQPLPGLKTRLYPYQARSAALMLQREAEPQLQLDPRLETRTSPDGRQFFFAPRDGSFLQQPVYYEANRGGILAESMGLGKTLICLAVILSTKHHLPQIPGAYQPLRPSRAQVGRLTEMAASTLGRHAIPARAFFENSEANGAGDFWRHRAALARNIPFYEIRAELGRNNRNRTVPSPQKFIMHSGTIIVVPRNLLNQWQSEIRKHVLKKSVKILVVDTVPKRGPKNVVRSSGVDAIEFTDVLPSPSKLMAFDVVLFTRNRFELEIQLMEASEQLRSPVAASRHDCHCDPIANTGIIDCNYPDRHGEYQSPLKKLHWLRMIIDEGHSFSGAVSNAVVLAKQIRVERRWVVSGTPAKDLVGVEIDVSTMDDDSSDATGLRDYAVEQRKSFVYDNESIKAVKALGSLASNFLQVRPWCDSSAEGKLEWDDYVYRHEIHNKRTYSAFSSCFLRTLEGLVVKTRPKDVEKDIVLPPMRHRVVYLQPCWFDKMTANLFIQVLRANAITSERTDVDYLFHKNSVKSRHSLIRNLRQSNFTWTGFSPEDVSSSLETSSKYLAKADSNCSLVDAQSLLESCEVVASLAESDAWIALSRVNEIGMAIRDWPEQSMDAFSLTKSADPMLVGITHLLDGQLHVDSSLRMPDPAMGLGEIGRIARIRIATLAESQRSSKGRRNSKSLISKPAESVPASCFDTLQARRPSTPTSSPTLKLTLNTRSPRQTGESNAGTISQEPESPSPARLKKRKLTSADETAMLPSTSPLCQTQVVGTTSAKLTYLMDKVMQYQATEKILIFYDGDDAAYYIAQCLEMLYINHRIYARTLDNVKRSEYVRLFTEDPDIRVLLIDVACGALGLNLNAASVVLIVNPINRPFLEAQAVKRAHRIGQTKEVLVETLVLENTIEHAIFNRAKKMSRADHLEAKELEDDADIIEIIQNAQILPVMPEEGKGLASYALLQQPQQVFSRPNRDKYHRFGFGKVKPVDRPVKKAKMEQSSTKQLVDVQDTPFTAEASSSSMVGQ